jgi:hypothetical protein
MSLWIWSVGAYHLAAASSSKTTSKHKTQRFNSAPATMSDVNRAKVNFLTERFYRFFRFMSVHRWHLNLVQLCSNRGQICGQ